MPLTRATAARQQDDTSTDLKPNDQRQNITTTDPQQKGTSTKVNTSSLDFLFKDSKNTLSEATRQRILRDRSFSSASSIFTNPLKPVMPLYGPPLESIIKTGPSMPGVSIAMMTPTEVLQLQRETHSLRLQLLERIRECPYADCNRYFTFADGDGLDRHVREDHSVMRCFLCTEDEYLLPHYDQKQIKKHFMTKHVDDILETFGQPSSGQPKASTVDNGDSKWETCPHCKADLRDLDEDGRRRHAIKCELKTAKKKEPKPEKRCKFFHICGAITTHMTQQQLRAHMKTHTDSTTEVSEQQQQQTPKADQHEKKFTGFGMVNLLHKFPPPEGPPPVHREVSVVSSISSAPSSPESTSPPKPSRPEAPVSGISPSEKSSLEARKAENDALLRRLGEQVLSRQANLKPAGNPAESPADIPAKKTTAQKPKKTSPPQQPAQQPVLKLTRRRPKKISSEQQPPPQPTEKPARQSTRRTTAQKLFSQQGPPLTPSRQPAGRAGTPGLGEISAGAAELVSSPAMIRRRILAATRAEARQKDVDISPTQQEPKWQQPKRISKHQTEQQVEDPVQKNEPAPQEEPKPAQPDTPFPDQTPSTWQEMDARIQGELEAYRARGEATFSDKMTGRGNAGATRGRGGAPIRAVVSGLRRARQAARGVKRGADDDGGDDDDDENYQLTVADSGHYDGLEYDLPDIIDLGDSDDSRLAPETVELDFDDLFAEAEEEEQEQEERAEDSQGHSNDNGDDNDNNDDDDDDNHGSNPATSNDRDASGDDSNDNATAPAAPPSSSNGEADPSSSGNNNNNSQGGNSSTTSSKKRKRPVALDTTYDGPKTGDDVEEYEYSEKSAVPDPLINLKADAPRSPYKRPRRANNKSSPKKAKKQQQQQQDAGPATAAVTRPSLFIPLPTSEDELAAKKAVDAADAALMPPPATPAPAPATADANPPVTVTRTGRAVRATRAAKEAAASAVAALADTTTSDDSEAPPAAPVPAPAKGRGRGRPRAAKPDGGALQETPARRGRSRK
jgi:hypothetical protein